MQVNDGSVSNNLSNVAVSTIHFTTVNDNPVLDLDANNSSLKTGADYQTTYTENGSGVLIADIDTKITDIDSPNLTSATIILTNPQAGDLIQVIGALPIGIASVGASTTTITLSGSSSIANYIAAIKQIQFSSSSDNPNTTDRIITVLVNDGLTNSNTATSYIKVVNVNDAPLVQNEYVTTNEDVKIVNNLSTITVNDIDVDNDILTVTINDNGNHGTASIVGNTYEYVPNPFYNGKDTVIFNVCDPYLACRNDTLFITINPVNSALILDLDLNNSSGKLGADYQDTFTENDAHIGIDITDNDVSILNPDNIDILSAKIILINKQIGDSLLVKGALPLGVSASVVYSASDITLNITGAKDATVYKSILEQIQFNNIRDDVSIVDRIINTTVANANGNSNIAITTLHVDNINDIPVTVITELFTDEDVVIKDKIATLLKNDVDPEGSFITIAEVVITQGENGIFSVNKTDSTFTYTPNKDFFGKDSVLVSVCDPQGACKNKLIYITVNPVNDPAVLDLDANNSSGKTVGDYLTTYIENATGVSIGDTDVSIIDVDNATLQSAVITLTNTKLGDNLFVTGSLPVGITSSSSTSGTATIITITGVGTKAEYAAIIKQIHFSSTLDFLDPTDRHVEVTVNDGFLNSNLAVTTIKMSNVNNNPIVTLTNLVTDEDVTITDNLAVLLKEDIDPEGGALTITAVTTPSVHGTFTLNPDGTFSYVPNPDYFGPDSVKVSVCDPQLLCSIKTIKITVNPINDASVLDLDVDNSSGKTGADYTTTYVENNAGISIGDVDVSIVDVDNVTLQSAVITLTNTKLGDSLFVTGSLPVGITSSSSTSGTATIITITGVGTKAEYAAIIKQIHFSSTLDFLDPTDRHVEVTVNDGFLNSNLAVTTIKMSNVNNNPIVTLTNLVTDEDVTITDNLAVLLKEDIDPEGGALTITAVTTPSVHGTFTLNPDGTFSYVPNPDYFGPDSVKVSVCDPQLLCSIKTIKITVNPINDASVLDLDVNNSSGKTGADYTTTFTEDSSGVNINDSDILITDVDDTQLSSALVKLVNTKEKDSLLVGTMPAGLIAIITHKGDTTIVSISGTAAKAEYEKAINQIKFWNNSQTPDITTRNIYVTVNDGNVNSNLAIAYIEVRSVNDDPNVKNDTLIVNEDTFVTNKLSTLLANDTDPDGDKLTITLLTNSLHGSITFTDSTYTYNPNNNYNGLDTAIFNVCDPFNLCKKDTLVIIIKPINDAPIVNNEYVTIMKNNTGIGIDFLKNDSDVETALFSSGNIMSSTLGKITLFNPNAGTFTYTPDNNKIGIDTIIYSVCDKGWPLPQVCKNDTIFIEVKETNLNCPKLDLDLNDVGLQIGIDYGFKYTENIGAVSITSQDVLLKDDDSHELASLVVELVNVFPGDSLIYDGGSLLGITYSNPIKFNDTIRISFTGKADTSLYKFALTHVKFINKRDDISSQTRIFDVSISDGNCATKANSFIYIIPEHDSAYINDELFVINEDTKLVKANHWITVNDYSPDGNKITLDTIAAHIVKNASKGVFVFKSDSTFIYTPNENFNGRDTVVVKVCDLTMCYNDTIIIIVVPAVDSLVVNNEYYEMNQGEVINSSIIINDYNSDGSGVKLNNVLVSHIVTNFNTLGTLTVSDNGQFTYVANTGVFGIDRYVYSVCSLPNGYLCKNDTLTFVIGGEVFPNGFSPGNGDGINDTYKISYPASYGKANLSIYNRWGDLVFEKDNYPNTKDNSVLNSSSEWDGTCNKGLRIGNDLPSGAYFFHIKFSKRPDKERIFTVTLQR